jgi:hypothetical protein
MVYDSIRKNHLSRHHALERVVRPSSGAILACVALREVRECLESLGEMLAKANTATGGTAETKIIVRFVGPGDKPERERP